MKDQELRDLLEEGTRDLAKKLGISLPDTWSAYQTRLILINAVPRVLPVPSGKVLVVDTMPEDRVRALLKEVLGDVQAGLDQGSSSDIGDMVVERLRRAGLDVDGEGEPDGVPVPPFFVDSHRTPPGEPDTQFQEMADAAQEAEHRHAETGKPSEVTDLNNRIVYESKGPPPEED